MTFPLSPKTISRLILRKDKSHQQGFTLIELLVSLIVGSLIVGTMLYFLVELLGVNAREERLTQAQQDTRRALDYISRDLREAIFVYADPEAIADQLSDAPADSTAVVAFWRLRPITIDRPNVAGTATSLGTCPANRADDCEILRVRHNVYDLVVYFSRENQPGEIWSGPNRIVRYELTKYAHVGNLTPTPGYVDPSMLGSDFPTWEPDGDTRGNAVVLTDSISDHDEDIAVGCPRANMLQFPADSNNFFTCVIDDSEDNGDDDDDNDAVPTALGQNQSLYVFLRGSIADRGADRPLTFGPTSDRSSLPTLNTEVQVRGVLEKFSDSTD
ncbi:prepilin-type N-terminal cleavage/methylation domain-containing protein [Nodosilinea sp. P-1105]|uniref:PilW family protein n=1 Tax=Nodosilinea sp. P-1105 TaxID=2546229 RepID=UPI00169599A7|nr:prepilin-type N-terminal cleavage/methylation domain-containing protein [Nodosilinea sp. P-1105]NMF86555.1 prepilin-type N-terminal cleavage/methylation domain-containing protein [Nodosilinea sp. P-1105]